MDMAKFLLASGKEAVSGKVHLKNRLALKHGVNAALDAPNAVYCGLANSDASLSVELVDGVRDDGCCLVELFVDCLPNELDRSVWGRMSVPLTCIQ